MEEGEGEILIFIEEILLVRGSQIHQSILKCIEIDFTYQLKI